MSSHNTQSYSNLPTDRTGNSFTISQIPDNNNDLNFQHTSVNNIGISNINSASPMTPMPQTVVFEFYFPLPNNGRIYHVTYTELHPLENARLLNNNINLSHVPDYQSPHHYNIQNLIQQQIQQRAQQPVDYQQNSFQQQSFNTMSIQPTSG